MKTAIMQPYLFPYIGYWQLINAVDFFVILDDVKFIKRGYINRNSILINGHSYLFSIPVKNASQNRLIKDTELFFCEKEKTKFLRKIENAYCKAPYFREVKLLLEKIIWNDTTDLTEYITYSIKEIMDYLNIQTIVIRSSSLHKDEFLVGQERIIEICQCLHTDNYINLSGGKKLYQGDRFKEYGLRLHFLNTRFDKVNYQQFNNDFVNRLSIIDILMFNSVSKVRNFLEEYELDE